MSSKIDIVLVGGGGHCKVVISILNKIGKYNIVGISDTKEKLGQKILGIPIKYTDDQLEELFEKGIKHALVTLGSVGNPDHRIRLFNMLKKIGFELPVIISPDSVVDNTVDIGEGSVIMPGVIINADTKIGKNCIINTRASIDHDCRISDHVHIAPGVTLSGLVIVGEGTHIGTGASVIQSVKIGKFSIIGAGSVVIKDVPDRMKVVGVPAKIRGKEE